MFHRRIIAKQSIILILSILLLLMIQTAAQAQNRSRISGTVRDASTGEPLAAANVMIENTNLGAAADLQGRFIIINVPVGQYRVKATMMGYETRIKTGVMVSMNRTTNLDFMLKPSVMQGEEVVVMAERDETAQRSFKYAAGDLGCTAAGCHRYP
ncbi:MAG: carboxypeptidase-like regulatory domain-containing protein [candidate division KSB1 bacterium]|nr:carboxypeptidase-like regulatory domain-containing protein [candidate division KSB1 bacterium]